MKLKNLEMREVGVGTRVINYLVDVIIIFLIAYGLYKWYTFYVRFWGASYIPYYIFFHSTTVFYYIIFESIWNRTPGKWLSITKVTNASGLRPAFYRIILRSVMRLTLIYPIFIPFLGRPLHDAISGTRVVES